MSSYTNAIIEDFKKAGKKIYMCITGGGTGAISKLLENGGTSDIFLGAEVPYTSRELQNLVGSYTKSVSEHVANGLARGGFLKASSADFFEKECYCIGVTASLAKNGKERQGRVHEAFVSIVNYDDNYFGYVAVYHVTFTKERTRKEEEDILSAFILEKLWDAVTNTKHHLDETNKLDTSEVVQLSLPNRAKKAKAEEKEVENVEEGV